MMKRFLRFKNFSDCGSMPGSEEFCREEVLRNTPMNNQNTTDSVFSYDSGDDVYRKFWKLRNLIWKKIK